MSTKSTWFRPLPVFSAAIILRIGLFLYGLWQDANSPVKYTDIDYYVFTDAARYVATNHSPYDRETYRYTPILSWLLIPTTWQGKWFSFGKALFALSDIITGWLIVLVLRTTGGMPMDKALKFASIWLLNPMVATISTRGSSEGLLAAMVVALVWAVMQRRIVLASVLLGVGVHFKIYPFIYAPSIVWWLDDEQLQFQPKSTQALSLWDRARKFCNGPRITLACLSFGTFVTLNLAMFYMYGSPFLHHTYLHHVTRVDHRHNFSPYNSILYLSSTASTPSYMHLESLAFIPQLFLSAIALPLLLAKKDLPSTMLAQTFSFVAFNKVCTSQYFLWYMVFLPFYLPTSSLLRSPRIGIMALVLWVLTQAMWLQQGFNLEFLGKSTFVPGLWFASQSFFLTNVWILGIIVSDIGGRARALTAPQTTSSPSPSKEIK
ncbi:hypothetical protein V490_08772 [Pseudogymnoascus sp. VKM F-3557]|nr:hypothetical protein V490_08772 [Pseudogymnoascus sp. VKM F-3557]